MNRRDFLRVSALSALAVGSAAFVERGPFARLAAQESVPLDPNLVAIFSDIHLIEPETSQQTSRFRQCVAKILALNPRPATLIIYGDIANNAGALDDYRLFRRAIAPVEAAGIRWEVAMGNHDRIANFRAVFPERFEKQPFIENRYINIVETPRADFIVLDSYLEGEVRGALDADQREWLAETLKKYVDKPVFVGCHHPLVETEATETLLACPKFAGYLYGHNHYWKFATENGVPTLCFPSVGHWGDMGFALMTLNESEAVVAPSVDAYFIPTWSKKKGPADVDVYLKELNAKTATFKLP